MKTWFKIISKMCLIESESSSALVPSLVVCGSEPSRCSGHKLFAVFVMISAYRGSRSVCLERLETNSACVSSSYFQQTLIVLATHFKYLPCASPKGAGVGIKSFITEKRPFRRTVSHTLQLFLWGDLETSPLFMNAGMWKLCVQCQASNWVNVWFQWFSISNFLSLHIMNY